MKAQRLHLLLRAKMSTLNAIRRFADTPAERHFQEAVRWINAAARHIDAGNTAEAAMENAMTHLRLAKVTLDAMGIA